MSTPSKISLPVLPDLELDRPLGRRGVESHTLGAVVGDATLGRYAGPSQHEHPAGLADELLQAVK